MRILNNRIGILPLPDPDKIGSIYIPDTYQRRHDQGIVQFVGKDVKDVRVGDLVLFSGYSGQLINIKSSLNDVQKQLIVVEEDFIVACLMRQGELETLNVPGLFLKDNDGYFPCPADVAIQFVRDALSVDKSIEAFESPKEVGKGV